MPGRLPKCAIGFLCQMEWSLAFAEWAESLHNAPTPELIRQRFDVSRSTAYRYLDAYNHLVERKLIAPPRGNAGR